MARGLPFTSASAPTRQAAERIRFQENLALSERWPPEALERYQFRHLKRLVDFAWDQIPFYRERLAATGYRPDRSLEPGHWEALELLTRRDIQREDSKRLHAPDPPPGHRSTGSSRTSGSTNTPVTILKSRLAASFHGSLTLRDQLWHRRDFAAKFASIRIFADGYGLYPKGAQHSAWLGAETFPFATGPAVALTVSTTVPQQVDWLRREAPTYLTTYPTLVRELARHCLKEGIRLPSLEQVCTIGEIVSDDMREVCREAFGAPIVDLYSAEEVGQIALQCPDYPVYHVQSEILRVEIVADDGRICGPGEVGRVVVTPLFGYAMPLLRYQLGDYAEVGDRCACGRGLPVLTRILGRTRNLMTLESGERIWPHFGTRRFDDIAPVIQFQFVQTAPDRLQGRLVTERPLTAEEEGGLREVILKRLSHPLQIEFVYCESIPRSKGGKFEDFVSLVSS